MSMERVSCAAIARVAAKPGVESKEAGGCGGNPGELSWLDLDNPDPSVPFAEPEAAQQRHVGGGVQVDAIYHPAVDKAKRELPTMLSALRPKRQIRADFRGVEQVLRDRMGLLMFLVMRFRVSACSSLPVGTNRACGARSPALRCARNRRAATVVRGARARAP